MKNIQNFLALVCVCILCAALEGCAYKHKNYPNESWFVKPTVMIDETQFTKLEEPLRVLLHVNYVWEGRRIYKDPSNVRSADWREKHGLWLASKRYLEETGMFNIVDIEEQNIQGKIVINVSRDMDEKTRALIAQQEAGGNSDEKIVYEYDMAMDMTVTMKGKDALKSSPVTNHMFIGHEDSKEKELGQDVEKFTFSYFNNMDFHTEFVRRFYKQMLYESLKQIEDSLLNK